MYTALTPQFNREARAFARKVGLPVVGNTDTHFLWQTGKTFTWIDAPADGPSVIEAIRHGRVEVATQPLRWIDVARFIQKGQSTAETCREVTKYMRKILRRTLGAERALRLGTPKPTSTGEVSPTAAG